MKRTLINQVSKNLGKKILVKGRVINLRRLGSISFVLLQDRSATIQVVWEKELAAKTGDIVELIGQVKKDERAKGNYEILGKEIKVISTSVEDFPFDLSKNELKLDLNNLLNYRTLSLRHPKIQAIFKLYDLLLKNYETVMREEGFVEIKTPKILGAASEGGANFFEIQYFEKSAFLAQSPQFYKQITAGAFERVFEIGPAFRAEPHFTTRHVNEYTSLDAEMAFIENFYDITATLNRVLKEMFERIGKEGKEYLALYGGQMSKVPKEIPCVKLAEIKKIIKEKYGYEVPQETDIDPQGERLAGRYAKEKYKSDFIFLTHYPWKEKPFYTLPDSENPDETCGFDLIMKGMEIVTGSQRIHLYSQLIENMKKKKVKPAGMEFYLNIFKFAMPPHGGWGMGSERLIQQILNLESVKEAVMFPRDVKRLSP